MGAASFTGLLFLGCGPLAVVFVLCLAAKSFLVLLALGRCAWLGAACVQTPPSCFPLARLASPFTPAPCPLLQRLLLAVHAADHLSVV